MSPNRNVYAECRSLVFSEVIRKRKPFTWQEALLFTAEEGCNQLFLRAILMKVWHRSLKKVQISYIFMSHSGQRQEFLTKSVIT